MPFVRTRQVRFTTGLWLFLFSFFCLFVRVSSGTDRSWTGATNTTWGTGTNWGGSAPGTTDNAVFNSAFSNQANVGSSTTIGGLWMTGSIGQNVTLSASGGVTLTLNGNTINGTAGLGILIDNANANTLTISAPLRLGNAQIWRNNSANLFSVTGTVNTNGKGLTIDGTGNTSISNAVSGSGLVTMSGGGTLTLSGTNTNTGGITINSGTVAIGAAANLGSSGTITLNAGTLEVTGTFSTSRNMAVANAASIFLIDASQTFTETGVLSGAGELNKTGAGTMVLSGNNTYSGGTEVSAGTLQTSANDRLSNTGALTISGGTFDMQTFNETTGAVTLSSGSITGTGTLTGSSYSVSSGSISTILAGTGGLTKSGGGTVTLTGANTYTGTTTVSGGSLVVNTYTFSPSATLSIASGATYTSTGTVSITPQSSVAATLVTGAGTWLLRDTSSTAGAPDIYYDPTGGTGTGWPVTIAAAVDVGTGTRYINGKSNRNDYERFGGDLIFGGALTGSATMIFTGTTNTATGGPWQMAYALQANNSGFTGGIALTDGANLILENANALSSANSVTFTPASGAVAGLYLYGRSVTIGALSGTAAGTMNIRNGSLVTDTNGTQNPNIVRSNSTLTVQQSTNTTFNGIISDGLNDHGAGDAGTYYTLALTKTGTGTLTLGGANTYTGGTAINGGTLSLGSSGAIGSSGTISFGGGTLQYSASNTTDYSSRFSLGASQAYSIDMNGQNVTFATGLTSLGGTMTKSGSGTLTLTGTNTFTGATVVNGGTLSVGGLVGSALSATSSITVNSGGTLLLSAANQINDLAGLTLAGGTLLKGNFSEGTASVVGVGALTLTAAGSKIDFGTGSVGILTFASLTRNGYSLTIDNWTGTARTQGTLLTDRLIFDSDQTSNLGSFNFTGYGPGALEIALVGGFYEIVPIPEVRTFVPGLLALVVVLVRFPFVLRLSVRRKRAVSLRH